MSDYEAVFQPEFRQDLKYWVESDRHTALRVLELVEAVLRDPFTGMGKLFRVSRGHRLPSPPLYPQRSKLSIMVHQMFCQSARGEVCYVALVAHSS